MPQRRGRINYSGRHPLVREELQKISTHGMVGEFAFFFGEGGFFMLHPFSRTELLIGKEGLQKLAMAKVAVFGLGGVGSFAAEALARSGVGNLVLIDHDAITITNINRQLPATLNTVGRLKVEV